MARVLHWIFRIIGGSLILSLIILAFIFYIVLRSIPDYDKSVELPGVIAPIEIVRDTFNDLIYTAKMILICTLA